MGRMPKSLRAVPKQGGGVVQVQGAGEVHLAAARPADGQERGDPCEREVPGLRLTGALREARQLLVHPADETLHSGRQ